MHLAQLNIAVPKYGLDDPRMADFVDNLVRINSLGASMPGFVWMLTDESGHASSIPTPWPDAIANMTVWETPEHLETFVWNTVHKRFYNRRQEWFSAMKSHHLVMWWVEEGHKPDLAEAKERLDHLDRHGDSDYAFGWSHLPHIKLWQSQRCG
ncbi:DUF3291 domain-containing protein [Oricola sp.]|uniref:DUF3291 domain-containing protein n=1 Tax=Oricola sp. TaxID=1979950 RepID=UPI003BAC03CD